MTNEIKRLQSYIHKLENRGIEDFDLDECLYMLRESLAERMRQHIRDNVGIRIGWCVEDVKAIRPKLSDVQAMTVLNAMLDNWEINLDDQDLIEACADELYPE